MAFKSFFKKNPFLPHETIANQILPPPENRTFQIPKLFFLFEQILVEARDYLLQHLDREADAEGEDAPVDGHVFAPVSDDWSVSLLSQSVKGLPVTITRH